MIKIRLYFCVSRIDGNFLEERGEICGLCEPGTSEAGISEEAHSRTMIDTNASLTNMSLKRLGVGNRLSHNCTFKCTLI